MQLTYSNQFKKDAKKAKRQHKWLLIYKISHIELRLVRVGSHSELF